MNKLRRLTAAALAAAVLAFGALHFIRAPGTTPERDGMRLAGRLGCFDCHGPGGTGNQPNPGDEAGEVPGWAQGAVGMYARNDADVRRWISSGRPPPFVAAPNPGRLLRMPAFGSVAGPGGIAALAAYVEAVGGFSAPPDPPARRGRTVASTLGCFGCHGPGGLTGGPNPRSFTGEIPPWAGGDFRALVRDEGELRDWILTGGIARFERDPLAMFFIRRAPVRMPAFRGRLSDADLAALLAYIESLRNGR